MFTRLMFSQLPVDVCYIVFSTIRKETALSSPERLSQRTKENLSLKPELSLMDLRCAWHSICIESVQSVHILSIISIFI